jgi:antitoxin component of MazEF toxin-antitoxin module
MTLPHRSRTTRSGAGHPERLIAKSNVQGGNTTSFLPLSGWSAVACLQAAADTFCTQAAVGGFLVLGIRALLRISSLGIRHFLMQNPLQIPDDVYTIVLIMNRYTATVIKTGNSLALRIPKQYADDAKLVPGDKVTLPLVTKQRVQDTAKLKEIMRELQAMNAFSSIKDPVAWQREMRSLDRPLPGRDY